jgi:predicted DNA-binding WGR domain protein
VEDESALEPVEAPEPTKVSALADEKPVETPAVPSPDLPPQNESVAAPAHKSTSSYFEFISGASKKFWEITVAGTSLTVRFGRIGTAGQSQTKTFGDEATAQRESAKLIAEKQRKGYAERGTK